MKCKYNGKMMAVVKLSYPRFDKWYFPNTIEGKIAAGSCIATNPADRYFGVTKFTDKILVLLHKSKEEKLLRENNPSNYVCDKNYF